MIAVIGGHSRSSGKTSVICGLIRALPEARWTAIKIAPHLHLPLVGPDLQRQAGTDRYLAAGAHRAMLISGPLDSAAASLREALAGGTHTMIESNTVLDLLRPDLYLFIINPAEPFKESAHKYLRQADAFVIVGEGSAPVAERPWFRVDPPGYTSDALVEFVRVRMSIRPAETKSPE